MSGDLPEGVFFSCIDANTFATHEHAGARRVNDDVHGFTGPLDLDARDASRLVLLADVLRRILVVFAEAASP